MYAQYTAVYAKHMVPISQFMTNLAGLHIYRRLIVGRKQVSTSAIYLLYLSFLVQKNIFHLFIVEYFFLSLFWCKCHLIYLNSCWKQQATYYEELKCWIPFHLSIYIYFHNTRKKGIRKVQMKYQYKGGLYLEVFVPNNLCRAHRCTRCINLCHKSCLCSFFGILCVFVQGKN